MTEEDFEALLGVVTDRLQVEVRKSKAHHQPDAFEQRVFDVLKETAKGQGIRIAPEKQFHAFPDIRANGFGIEVKSTIHDSWQSVGNSVFEGTRAETVKTIYVVFGKMGGTAGVRWRRYEESITHVRISHAPRFVLEMDKEASLFKRMGVTYAAFCDLKPEGKMAHIRKYSRGRLKPGERLWWIEDQPGQPHALEMGVRLYMKLETAEKRRMRAEAALLCPKIVQSAATRNKYNDAALYLLTYHGVFCPQARDLFTAGSVALKADGRRGGNYLLRALHDIQPEMRTAAQELETALFTEYWGHAVPPKDRIRGWLRLADGYAKGWKPSEHLFQRG